MDKLDTDLSISEIKEMAVLKVWQWIMQSRSVVQGQEQALFRKHETLGAESPAFLITLHLMLLLNEREVKIYIPLEGLGLLCPLCLLFPLPHTWLIRNKPDLLGKCFSSLSF